jgi:ankyrin repeat protein
MELATSECDMHIKDISGKLPLHLAAIRGNLECCSYLSVKNVGAVNFQDSMGRSPFFYACKGKNLVHAEIADLFLDDSDLMMRDKKMLSPLHYAVLNHHKQLIERMMYTITNVDIRDIEGVTPLMLASACGFLSLIKMLVRQGADCNLMDNQGRISFQYAKINNREKCIAFLEPRTSKKEPSSTSTIDVEILQKSKRYRFLRIILIF